MHYKNGRKAKPGDVVVSLSENRAGIVYNLSSGSATCNARLVAPGANDPYVTLSQCLHIDDVKAAEVPDTTIAPSTAP